MLENIRLSFQGVWSHRLRSFLTMLGIIIGIAAIIAIVSTIKGTNEQIKKNLIGSGTNTTTVQLSLIHIYSPLCRWRATKQYQWGVNLPSDITLSLIHISIQIEEEFSRMTKESLDEKSEQKKQEKTEKFQTKKEKESEEEQFALLDVYKRQVR